jgi:GntR family transcriptional regulator
MVNSSNKRRIKIDSASPIPVYRQVADQIREALVGGAFRPGERLPTVRQIALDLGLNHNTIAQAYRVLAGEGWVRLERARGAVVLARNTPGASKQTERQFARRLRELIAEVRAAGVSSRVIRSEFESLSEALPASGEEKKQRRSSQ